MEYKDDADNYRKMSEPFENADKANEAIIAFNEELSELRKKHRIKECFVVISGNVLYGDKEGQYIISFNFGSMAEVERLAAWGYGKAQADRKEFINTAVEQAASKK